MDEVLMDVVGMPTEGITINEGNGKELLVVAAGVAAVVLISIITLLKRKH